MIKYYNMSIGRIGIVEEKGAITQILLESDSNGSSEKIGDSPLLDNAAQQIEAYLNGEIKSFDLPLNPKGTPFMVKVWEALQKIPYGETRTYKDIAIGVGSEKAYRAVGMANNKNPIPIIIPCHRVVGTNGTLVGYRGGLDLKSRLLEIEKNQMR